MANAEFQITLREGEPAGALMQYAPNGVIRGEVRLTTDGAVNCRGAYLRLMWHTEGRGDRDEEKLGEIVLSPGALPANANIQRAFEFTLPIAPWSYAGQYINIVWEIVGVVDLPLAKDIVAREPFIVAPRRT
ncbi:MAG: hypothetical protein HY868_16450 [Chloroflexi bacterium]|nr:hypothetical protein [Chloroflexota bacterium]